MKTQHVYYLLMHSIMTPNKEGTYNVVTHDLNGQWVGAATHLSEPQARAHIEDTCTRWRTDHPIQGVWPHVEAPGAPEPSVVDAGHTGRPHDTQRERLVQGDVASAIDDMQEHLCHYIPDIAANHIDLLTNKGYTVEEITKAAESIWNRKRGDGGLDVEISDFFHTTAKNFDQ